MVDITKGFQWIDYDTLRIFNILYLQFMFWRSDHV